MVRHKFSIWISVTILSKKCQVFKTNQVQISIYYAIICCNRIRKVHQNLIIKIVIYPHLRTHKTHHLKVVSISINIYQIAEIADWRQFSGSISYLHKQIYIIGFWDKWLYMHMYIQVYYCIKYCIKIWVRLFNLNLPGL